MTKKDLEQIGQVVKAQLKPVFEGIGGLQGDVRGIKDDVGGLKGDFRYLNSQINRLDKRIDGVKTYLAGKINKVMNHVDGFAKRQLKFDSELAAEKSARERLAERIA